MPCPFSEGGGAQGVANFYPFIFIIILFFLCFFCFFATFATPFLYFDDFYGIFWGAGRWSQFLPPSKWAPYDLDGLWWTLGVEGAAHAEPEADAGC